MDKYDYDFKLTTTMARYIIGGFLIVVAIGVGSCQSSKYQYRTALTSGIQAGADPLAMRCALLGEGSLGGTCAMLMQAEAERNRQ